MFNNFDEVKSMINLSDIVKGDYKKMPSGYRYKICPICGGEYSFNIMPKGLKGNDCQVFKCFKCDNSGTVIDYYCLVNGLNKNNKKDILTSVRELNKQYIDVSISKKISRKDIIYKPNSFDNINNRIYDFTEVAEELHQNLVNKDRFFVPSFVEYKDMATSYYIERGLSVEVIKKFKLGYHLGGIDEVFKKLPELRMNDELGYYKYFIPFYENGKCVYILPRLDDDAIEFYKEIDVVEKDFKLPKTMNLRGVPSNIFNFQGSLESNIVFITEGWCDALSIETLGCSALALNSVSNINKFIEKLKAYRNYINKYYIIALDADKSGYDARNKLSQELIKLRCKVKHLYPSGKNVKDINDMLLKNRVQLEYELNQLKDEINIEKI